MTQIIPQDSTNVLAPFTRIIGQWQNQEQVTLTHEIAWGIDKRIVNMRSFDQTGKSVSEGCWFWHPGEGVIKGYAVANKMPVVFFDYTVKSFEGNVLKMALTAYSPSSEAMEYIETWTFTDDDHYSFMLESITPDGTTKLMEIGFIRKS